MNQEIFFREINEGTLVDWNSYVCGLETALSVGKILTTPNMRITNWIKDKNNTYARLTLSAQTV